MRTKRIYKARLLYFFECEKCGTSNRQTYKRSKLRGKICRSCQRTAVDPNQQTLFPVDTILDRQSALSDNVPEV